MNGVGPLRFLVVVCHKPKKKGCRTQLLDRTIFIIVIHKPGGALESPGGLLKNARASPKTTQPESQGEGSGH